MYNVKNLPTILQPYVKRIHNFSLDSEVSCSMTAIPTGNIFLSLTWGGGSYALERPSGKQTFGSSGIMISGQQTEIANHKILSGKLETLGIELTPNAIHQFFGIPQYELTDQIIKLEDIWPCNAMELYDQIKYENDGSRMLSLIEGFLIKRITSKNCKTNNTIEEAVSIINRANGNISVNELAKVLRISIRTLERRFIEIVGVSPKTYSKIIQFNTAFSKITIFNKQIHDIVLESGYYDQSHFLNHFKKVFGKSPGKYWEEQEILLDLSKKDGGQGGLNSIVGALNALGKLYVF